MGKHRETWCILANDCGGKSLRHQLWDDQEKKVENLDLWLLLLAPLTTSPVSLRAVGGPIRHCVMLVIES